MGACYFYGAGVAKDLVQAASWYRKAADQDYAPAQNLLGQFYYNGTGVAKSTVRAVSWFRMAADQGDAKAQYNLGYCYANGEGVRMNEVEAYAYWSTAGITDEIARKNLAMLRKQMSSGNISAGQKRAKELQKEIDAKIAAKQAGK